MTRIELSPYDRDDLIKYLQYAKEKKIENKKIPTRNDRWDDSKYDCMRIDYLIRMIEGKIYTQGFYTSSAPEVSEEDKRVYAHCLDVQKKKKNESIDDDLYDVIYEEENEPWWKN